MTFLEPYRYTVRAKSIRIRKLKKKVLVENKH